jgi:hypothetical protein
LPIPGFDQPKLKIGEPGLRTLGNMTLLITA